MSNSLFAFLASAVFVFDDLWHSNSLPALKVSENGAFLSEWPSLNDESPPCQFYNATYQFSDGLCSHFAIARMSASTQQEATERALACAAHYETDCILSAEIGLAVPAAFVYDQEAGLKMVIAPKVLPSLNETATTKRVGLQNPGSSVKEMLFNETVRVHYLRGGSRVMENEVFSGSSAYCVQLLRFSFDSLCWNEID